MSWEIRKVVKFRCYAGNGITSTKVKFFLDDKGFCDYYDLSSLADKGVASVVTIARRNPVTADQILGENDLLIHWKKPVFNKKSSYSRAQCEAPPERLSIRQIRITVTQKGFRTSHFYIATTLLDAELYPADEISDLYLQRWDVEFSFRDIKTTRAWYSALQDTRYGVQGNRHVYGCI